MKTKQQLVKALSASVFAAALFLCSSAVFAQVKIGTNPTVINPANNLEVESTDPAKKVSINKTTGKTTLADGSQGAGYILTSDANGVATWKYQKATSIYTFTQSANVVINLPTASGVCAEIGCATDLNRNGSFTITKPVNDVVVDITGIYAIAGNNSTLQYTLLIAIDRTTPDTYESLAYLPVVHSSAALGCYGMSFNLKSVATNLPPRAAPYKLKVYVAPFTNVGSPAVLAIGGSPAAGCGSPLIGQNLIVSVSE